MPRGSRRPQINSDDESNGLSDIDITESEAQPPTPSSNRTSQKWPHDQISGGSNGGQAVNSNLIAAAKSLAKRRKLTDDQVSDVETFLNENAIGREVRSYIVTLDLINKVDKIVKNQAQWEPSAALKRNINHYVNATSLSPHLRSFLGPSTVAAVVTKLLDLGLELPENIRQNQSALDQLTKLVAEAFTQRRSTMKKAIKASVGVNNKKSYTLLPAAECQNIYELAQTLARNTKCGVSAELCARAAILRRAFEKSPGDEYWERVDKLLKDLCEKGKHDPKLIANLVKNLLEKDCGKYGTNDYQIRDQDQSDLQTAMDEVLESQVLGEGDDARSDRVEDGDSTGGSADKRWGWGFGAERKWD
ncbi:hypothetical protein K435DRAFT_799832 [Dendrothele bispora CBS 962.96]|uniref:Uncharacterized protein n=1 Tax=Dendrothele bispora (strain CBS 962.96) TaxID=1314807 RepID=A0A4S8LUN0_DENBC|nr:hypothetical protein K435DRAFT_799832 [Dendrothele bispora CBS 962.96]